MSVNTNERKLQKLESFKRLINLMLSAVCLALEISIFAYHWMNNFNRELVEPLQMMWEKGNALEISIYGAMLFFFSKMYGGMRLGYLKNTELVFSQIFATMIANVMIYAELCMMARAVFLSPAFPQMVAEQIIAIIIYINIANRIYRSIFPPRKLVIVHGKRPVEDICEKFAGRKDKYTIAGRINVKCGVEKVCEEILHGYHTGKYTAVVLWDITELDRKLLLKFCYAHSIRVYMMPKITDVIILGAEELHIFDSPILLTREYNLTMEERFIKRSIDIVCAALLLLIASPIMLVTAIAVKISDGGPILYKQVRCTLNQREFYILKFRSMRTDAERDGVARLAQKNDSRITPVGKIIRKCRVDELPQLLNILKGDMSFIGPRPERPEIIEQYMEVMPEFAYRMKVKAGLAGLAQVYGKYNTSPYDKLKLDLTYIEQYSIWLDLKLMLLTLKVLLWPDSTEGVESEQVTAFKAERKASRESEEKDAAAEED